ncbi:MAG: TetR family transcriptional regulator [Acidimicrobiia bacterium]
MTVETTLRERKRAKARAELIHAAIGLFERQGFAATTIGEIADTAEYSQSTFFRYFGTKEDVLFADVDDHLGVLRQHLADELGTGTVWDAVIRSVEGTTRAFISSDPEFGARRIELWMSEPALRARYIEHAAAWEAAIRSSVARHRGKGPGDDVYASIVAMGAITAFRVAVESLPSNDGSFLERLHSGFELLGKGLAEEPRRRRK